MNDIEVIKLILGIMLSVGTIVLFVLAYELSYKYLYSEVDVYYDPSNPKLAYVLRYCNKKWTFYVLFFSAVFVLVTDLLILIVL